MTSDRNLTFYEIRNSASPLFFSKDIWKHLTYLEGSRKLGLFTEEECNNITRMLLSENSNDSELGKSIIIAKLNLEKEILYV